MNARGWGSAEPEREWRDRQRTFEDTPEARTVAELDRLVGTREPIETLVILGVASTQVATIAARLADADRELRRAVNVHLARERGLDDGQTRRSAYGRGAIPRPIPAARGGLNVIAAASGSLHLLTEPFGLLMDVLTSQPTTAILNMLALGERVARYRIWRYPGSAGSVSGQHATLEAVRLIEADQWPIEPDHDLLLIQGRVAERELAELHLRDGTLVRGESIDVVIREASGAVIHIRADV